VKRPTDDMLGVMLGLQDRMNLKIHPHWRGQGYDFLRAVFVEAAEALEHYGWKWWKHQEPNIGQLRIELVDIWHFLLSHYIVKTAGDLAAAVRMIGTDWDAPPEPGHCGPDVRTRIEVLGGLAALRQVSLPLFSRLLDDCGMDAERLYRDYVSKNVLNHFRQDHGYKTGEYRKMWQGREDNEHMVEILERLRPGPGLAEELYRELERTYRGA
jgi:hypothetical protein